MLKKDGAWVRNPLVRTDAYLEDGEVVYGEPVTGDAGKAAKELLKACTYDFSRLDAAVNDITWRMANLFPSSLQMSIDMVRAKKKFFWDQSKLASRHWLSANMMGEAFLGFHAFSTRKLTGEDVIDFIKFRQQIANGVRMDDDSFAEVMPKPLAE